MARKPLITAADEKLLYALETMFRVGFDAGRKHALDNGPDIDALWASHERGILEKFFAQGKPN